MKKKERRLAGSFTLEAAWIMAMVFFSISVVFAQAGKMHDETAGAMVLHEAVEKGRHEKGAELARVGEAGQKRLRPLLAFPSYDISLKETNGTYQGLSEGGSWKRTIEMKAFRPEKFLRKITLVENLGEAYGD